ncbi:MAG: response regulator, partial [Gammaproteobacteria bacterium]|nr:response regulator [Gammaproteobacteria bacterium]
MARINSANHHGGMRYHPNQSAINKLLDSVMKEQTYSGFLLLESDGHIISSDKLEYVGKKFTNPEDLAFLKRVLQGPNFTALNLPFQRPEENPLFGDQPMMMVGASIPLVVDSIDAILVFLIDPARDFSEFLKNGRMGQTGESYAFNDKGEMISESRFTVDLENIGLVKSDSTSVVNVAIKDPGGDLTKGFVAKQEREDLPLTLMAKKAVNGINGMNLDGYNDYRGVPVVGTWLWESNMRYGIVTEMDFSEAYQSIQLIRKQTITGVSVTIVLIFLLTALFIRNRVLASLSHEQLKQGEEKLSSQKEQLQMAYEAANLGLWDWRPQTGELFTNDIWETMLGYEPNTFPNTADKWSNLVHPDDLDKAFAAINDNIEGRTKMYHFPHRLKSKEGQWKWIDDYGKVVERDEQGNPVRFIGVHIDIDETKKLEEALLIAKLKAESATQAKSDFLANMSHEIRTPMNAIIGLTDLAMKTELTPKQEDYLSKVFSSANALLGIINDILDFSKIEAGKLKLEHQPFFLDDVLSNLATVVTLKTQEKGVELLFSIAESVPHSLIGDSLRLGQILINITNNAAKFTNNGEIVISIKTLEYSDDSVKLKFSIQDSGIGMTEEQMDNLFQSFSQADTSTSRKYGGTGLGLTISKQLVEMMNGRIWVNSEYGKGSTFCFEALFGVDHSVEIYTQPLASDLEGMNVLVVDDNAVARGITVTYLEQIKVRVNSADNGEKAIEMIKQSSEPYQLILMDYSMSTGMSGLQTTEIIKNQLSLEVLPKIILLTSHSHSDFAGEPGEELLDHILQKPITASLLLDSIMTVFGQETELSKNKRGHGRTFNMQSLLPVQGASILLVEDNKINQQVARELLQQAKFMVDIANNGQEALQCIETKDYDCVLMDIQMPVMDGYEAAEKIRAQDKYKHLPILALTANAMAEEKEKVMMVGMNEHIAKPINPNELFTKLLQWIQPNKNNATILENESTNTETPVESEVVDKKLTLMIPGLDIDAVIEQKGFSQSFMMKLLSDFYDDHHADLEIIIDDLNKQSLETPKRMVHTIKGIAGTIGANELFESSKNLDLALKNNECNAELIDAFKMDFKAIMSALKTSLAQDQQKQKPSESKQTEFDSELFNKELAELRDMLTMMDTASEDKLKDIQSKFGPYLNQQILKQLINDVDNFDFEHALTIIKQLT